MMRTQTAALVAALALPALVLPAKAHDAGGVVHMHPHGGEALIALVVLTVAAIAVWRMRRR